MHSLQAFAIFKNMDYYRARIQRTLDYIEANLKADLTISSLAAIACFSPFHFSRIFPLYTGNTVMEYIRSRRLSCALSEIKAGRRPLIEIALDYSFASRDSFTRAFKRVYGLSPGQCRKMKIYPVPGFKIDLREPADNLRRINMITGLEMKIRELPALKIAGYELRTNQEKGFKEIPSFWQKMQQSGKLKTTPEKLPIPAEYAQVCLGYCTPLDPQTGTFSYIIGWPVSDFKALPGSLATRENPAITYAIFTTPTTEAKYFTTVIQLVTRYIYHDWLPQSGYEYDCSACDMEWYDERAGGEQNISMDICVPVRKKTS